MMYHFHFIPQIIIIGKPQSFNRHILLFTETYSVVCKNVFCCLQKRILLFAETICTALTVPLTEQHLSLYPNCPVHTVQ